MAIRLSNRRVEVAGITRSPDAAWGQQAGRNLSDFRDGFLIDVRILLLDRNTTSFPLRGASEGTDTAVVHLLRKSPNLNAYIERFMRTIKSVCLDRMVLFWPKSLDRALDEFVVHYHDERNHQGLDNDLIDPSKTVGRTWGNVACRDRLGGMLRYYHREAAQPSVRSESC